MPPPKTPTKPKYTKQTTAQTGMMEEMDAIRPGYMTPKKMGAEDDYSPVRSVKVSTPTAEEADIGSRQEEFDNSLKNARGGKSRKSRKAKKTRKTRKVKKHGKRKH